VGKYLRRLGAVMVLCLTIGALAATAANACSSSTFRNGCSGGFNGCNDHDNYYDGYVLSPPADTGVSCPNGVDNGIWINNPSIGSGTTNSDFSVAWNGLVKFYTGGWILAQIGYEKDGTNGGTRYNFSELVDNNSLLQRAISTSAPALNTTQDYKTTYSGGAFHTLQNGLDFSDWPYTSNGIGNSTCFTVEGFGEISSYVNQMPGTVDNLESIAGLQIRGGTNWIDESGQLAFISMQNSSTSGTHSLSVFKHQINNDGHGTYWGNLWDTCGAGS